MAKSLGALSQVALGKLSNLSASLLQKGKTTSWGFVEIKWTNKY